MILSIPKSALQLALSAALRGVSGKPPMTIVSYLLLRASGSELQVVGTTLDIAIRATVDCDVLAAGEILLPARCLLELVTELPDGTIRIEVDSKYSTTIQPDDGSSRFSIQGNHPGEFPDPFQGTMREEFQIARTDLSQIADHVSFAVSTDVSRLALTGIFLELATHQVIAVATDGKILARRTAPIFSAAPSTVGGIILPPSVLEAVLPGATAPSIVVAFPPPPPDKPNELPKEAHFIAGAPEAAVRVEGWCKLIEGPYPKWREVVRSSSLHRAEFPRQGLVAILRRLRAVRLHSSSAGVKFHAVNGRAELSLETPESSGRDDLGPHGADAYDIPDWAVDPVRFAAILSHVSGSTVRLEISQPLQAIHVLPGTVDASDPLFIIMPLRLED